MFKVLQPKHHGRDWHPGKWLPIRETWVKNNPCGTQFAENKDTKAQIQRQNMCEKLNLDVSSLQKTKRQRQRQRHKETTCVRNKPLMCPVCKRQQDEDKDTNTQRQIKNMGEKSNLDVSSLQKTKRQRHKDKICVINQPLMCLGTLCYWSSFCSWQVGVLDKCIVSFYFQQSVWQTFVFKWSTLNNNMLEIPTEIWGQMMVRRSRPVSKKRQLRIPKQTVATMSGFQCLAWFCLVISYHFISVFIWMRWQGFVSPHFSTTCPQHMSERVQGELGKNQRKFKLIMWIQIFFKN